MEIPYFIILGNSALSLMFVDASTGDDGDDGSTWALAKKTITNCVAAGATEIHIRNSHATDRLSAGFLELATDSTPRRLKIVGHYSTGVLSRLPLIMPGDVIKAGEWSSTGGKLNTYEAACLKTDMWGGVHVADPNLLHKPLMDDVLAYNGGSVALIEQVSIQGVDDVEGSWYLDDGNDLLYVHIPHPYTHTYFAEGGGIVAMSANTYGVNVRYGSAAQIENCHIWGGAQAMYGGRLFLHNCFLKFAQTNALYSAMGGSIYGSGLDIQYAHHDGVSIADHGIIKLKNSIVAHHGIAATDQCITGHDNAVLEMDHVVAYDSAGSVVAPVASTNILFSDCLFKDPAPGRSLIDAEGQIRGLVRDCVLMGGASGLYVAPDAGVKWGFKTALKLQRCRFLNNTYDIKVTADIESTVYIHDCDYKTIHPTNNNVTVIPKPKAPVVIAG